MAPVFISVPFASPEKFEFIFADSITVLGVKVCVVVSSLLTKYYHITTEPMDYLLFGWLQGYDLYPLYAYLHLGE